MFGDDPVIHQAIFRAIAVSLDLTHAYSDTSWILRSYATPPPPVDDRNANFCFYDLSPDPQGQMLTEHTILRSVNAIYRFMPYLLTIVFYGPAAETNAIRVRDNLFVDGAAHPLSILRQAGIYPIPLTAPPSVVYEEEGSLFRKRADLVLSVRLLDNSDDVRSGSLEADPVEISPDTIINL